MIRKATFKQLRRSFDAVAAARNALEAVHASRQLREGAEALELEAVIEARRQRATEITVSGGSQGTFVGSGWARAAAQNAIEQPVEHDRRLAGAGGAPFLDGYACSLGLLDR